LRVLLAGGLRKIALRSPEEICSFQARKGESEAIGVAGKLQHDLKGLSAGRCNRPDTERATLKFLAPESRFREPQSRIESKIAPGNFLLAQDSVPELD